MTIDEAVKSPKTVIPAKAGIYSQLMLLDSRLRGNDNLRNFCLFTGSSQVFEWLKERLTISHIAIQSRLQGIPSHCLIDMHIISKKKITDFISKYPASESSLLGWYSIVGFEGFSDFNEPRDWFPHADLVGRRTVFNISGNRYRMMTRINYISKRIFIFDILTHSEYSKNK